MKWKSVALRKVAPPKPSSELFSDGTRLWQLSLDQIEGGTGRIIGKKYGDVREAGSSTFSFDPGNVLYSKLRPYLNKVAIPDEPGIATTELIPLRPDASVLDQKYLAFYLRSAGFVSQASHHVAGAKMPRVAMDWFWEHEIPLPPLSEQRRIVEILSQVDQLRRLRREVDAKATRILPALFLRNFGDPASNPKGWPVRSIGEVTTLVTSGSTPRGGAQVYVHEGPYLIRSQNVLMNRLDLSDVARISIETHSEMSRTHVQRGDVLLNITGASIGRVAWVKRLDVDANVNQHVCIIRPDPLQIASAFLSMHLSLPHQQSIIASVQAGASRQALNHVQVRALKVLVPPLALQNAFANNAHMAEEILERSDHATRQLEDFFNVLTQRAFSGRLTSTWRDGHTRELFAELEQQARLLNLPPPNAVRAAAKT